MSFPVWAAFVAGLFLGWFAGVGVMCALGLASESDDEPDGV